MSSRPQARPAALSDFDDAAGIEKPGIIDEARTARNTVIQQPNPPSRVSSRSGRGRSTTIAGEGDLAIRTRTPATTTVVQARRSASRSQAPTEATAQQPPQRLSSTTRRQSMGCGDPACGDPGCQSARNTDRRYVIHRPAAVPIQPSASTQTYPNINAQPTASGAVPRARSSSYITARPQSWAGVPYPQYSMPVAQPPPPARGPPPSPSAYHNLQTFPQYPGYHAQVSYPAHPPYVHSTSYITPVPSYLPHATETQPFLPQYSPSQATAVQSPINEMYNPRLPSQTSQISTNAREPRRLTRSGSISARAPAPPMPGSWIPDEDAVSVGDDSDSDYYEERYSPRKRDSILMPPPSRPVQLIQRPSARLPDPPEYRSSGSHSRSSSYVDSDRTPRQSDVRRQSSNASSRSRHHSVSTGASSHRTPATTISTGSRGDYVTIEDRHGRRQYLSAEDYVRLQRYQAQQQAKSQKTADAESYQNAMRGGAAEEITVDKIRRFIDPPAPKSRASTNSRRSGQSATQSEGIKISYGETTMHVTGGARVELHNDADGGAHFVINPGLGREKPYYTETASTESRLGRSRGSDRDVGNRRRSTLETVAD